MMPHKDAATRRAYHRDWKRRNRGRYRDHARAWDSARHANERAEHYGAPGRISWQDAATVLAVGRCYYCGRTEGYWFGLDHVVPLCDGGPNEIDNIVCCCHPCNASKWRQDRPYRWSRRHDRCVDCGTNERKHLCHGFCSACWSRRASRNRRALA